MDHLASLWNVMLTQRFWSWAAIGIVYLLTFLVVRSFFLRGLIKGARGLNSKWYHAIKKVYMRKCIAGWILFLVSFMLLIFFWQTADFRQASLYEVAMVFLIILTVLFAIMSQIIALGASAIQVLKSLENNQMSL